MGFEMKPEKEEVPELVPRKDQCKSKNPSPNSVNSSNHKKKMKKNKKKTMMTWRRRMHEEEEDEITAVRKLFITCKQVFSDGGPGVVPADDKIQKLREILDEMKPEDVGLSPSMRYFRPKIAGKEGQASPPITYLHLHQCERFSIGIFCLPPSGVIPLHNHPQMTVFSKLLFGTMHIKSYDWVADAPMKDPKTRLAKLQVNSTFTAPCKASILFPEDGGNMHRFTAETACAVLDVLGPPYCNPEGRHCTYFLEFPHEKFSAEDEDVLKGKEKKEGYAWLEERDENPKELNVVGALYRGPKVED